MPSSVIYGMRYSPDDRTLDIVFRANGDSYRYHEVGAAEWQQFRRAPSKGTYLNAVFKARHPHVQRIATKGGTLRGALLASVAGGAPGRDLPDENVWGFYE